MTVNPKEINAPQNLAKAINDKKNWFGKKEIPYT